MGEYNDCWDETRLSLPAKNEGLFLERDSRYSGDIEEKRLQNLSENETVRRIKEECDNLCTLLIAKNKSYGDSVANPVNIFAKGLDPLSQLYVRIDDKLSRIARGSEIMNEDTVLDLIGYLVLSRVLSKSK